jgi:cobalt/nickel transport system permease protein
MRGTNFVGTTIRGFTAAAERALESEELARADGLLQRLDPRVKVLGIAALILSAAASRSFAVILSIFALALALAILSHVPVRTLASRVWVGALFFTGAIALPALFLTRGRVMYRLPILAWPVTESGLRSAAYLIARVETTATLALLLVLCTPWAHILKALRVFRVPPVLIVILGMTYRYIFLMLESAREMFESRRSRLVGRLDGPARRRVAVATAGVLLDKTFHLGNEVFLAMQSRGFRGEVHLLDDFAMRPLDYAGLAAFLGVAAGALYIGH